jgi:hypothetical protein
LATSNVSRKFVNLPKIEQISINDPDRLLGWTINVHGRGTGTVSKVIRKKFRTTRFLVVFKKGFDPKPILKLRRGNKGEVAWTPVSPPS